jgi:hypothetical protein
MRLPPHLVAPLACKQSKDHSPGEVPEILTGGHLCCGSAIALYALQLRSWKKVCKFERDSSVSSRDGCNVQVNQTLRAQRERGRSLATERSAGSEVSSNVNAGPPAGLFS